MVKTKTKTDTTKKTSNFELVASGKCPHDNASLGDEVAGKGVGITRTCSSCGHRWYLNKKIHTCKCQTCSADKQKSKKGD